MDASARNTLIGDYLNCYSGYAAEHNLRYTASSGGAITALLVFALKNKIIDGAVVVRMKKESPLEAESFVARTEEEIILAKGSKYCPVLIGKAVQELAKSDLKRVAVVGLPCQIKAIKQVAEKNPVLKSKISFYFGIFCSRTPNARAIDFLLKRYKIKKEEIFELNYRGQGWPGSMTIVLKNGKEIKILLTDYWNIVGSDYFTPKACFLCSDHTAELADFSFGDAWLPEFAEDKIGTSIIISRTSGGEEILKRASEEKAIKIDPISPNQIIFSQSTPLYFKKKGIRARATLFNKKISEDNTLTSDSSDYFLAFFPLICAKLANRKIFLKILDIMPFSFFSLYNKIFKFLYNKRAKSVFKKYGVKNG